MIRPFLLPLLFFATNASAQTSLVIRDNYEAHGAKGDCSTDDTAAMIATRDALRAFQDANMSSTVKSVIDMKQGKCYVYSDNRIFWGLKNLVVNGNSASLALQYPTFINQLVLPGALITSNQYTINIPGTTNWTSVGAANNNQGTTFTATGTTTGTGYAVPVTNPNEGSAYTYGISGPIGPYTYTGVGPWPSGSSAGVYYYFNRSGLETELASGTRSGSAGFAAKPIGPYISNVTSGANSVSCITSGQCNSTAFPVGQWVWVNSYEMQPGASWPPNIRFGDYAKVVSADGTNIVLDRTINHNHLQTNPKVPSGPLDAGYGPAMIIALGDPVNSVAPSVPFADSMVINNLTLTPNPYAGQPGDCCSPSTTYGDDTPGDHHFFYAHTYNFPGGVYSITFNNVTGANFTPSGASIATWNNSKTLSGGEIDKMLTTVNFNNVISLNYLGGCSADDTVNYTGGIFTTPSFFISPIGCTARTVNVNNVLLMSPHLSVQTYLSGISLTLGGLIYPSTMSVTNSTFWGGDGTSTPIGGAQGGFSFTIDGTIIKAASATRLYLTAFVSPNLGMTLLSCAYVGRTLTLVHGGMNYVGTIVDILSDGGTGAYIDMSGLGASITNGDTIDCFAYQTGSVTQSGNSFNNYGGGPILP